MTTVASSVPPPRPDKSKLRGLAASTRMPGTASAPNVSRLGSPVDRSLPTSAPTLTPIPASPIQGNAQIKTPTTRSRFTEHFDLTPSAELMTKITNQAPLPTSRSNKTTSMMPGFHLSHTAAPPALTDKKDTTASVVTHPSRQRARSSPSTPISFLKRSLSTSNYLGNAAAPRRPTFVSPLSTPQFPKDGQLGPIEERQPPTPTTMTTSTRSTENTLPRTTFLSLNRAEVVVARLENWLQLIKAVSSWLEETARMGLQSSQNHYQRVLPLVKRDLKEMDAMATINGGLQMLTLQLAADQREFAKSLQRNHLPALQDLKKECKEKVRELKADQTLALDELLRRADMTRKSMAQLTKCCKTAQDIKGPVTQDPWLVNLSVLCYLKREVEEENRLSLRMLQTQREMAALERRLLSVLKPTIQFCYQGLAPSAWDGTHDADTAPFRLMLDQIVAHREWKAFAEREKKELVDEQDPIKNYLSINYPNKRNPHVMTLQKGMLARQFGVIKHFSDRLFALSHGGYLHQFRSIDTMIPERTIYIPTANIVPMVDPGHLTNDAPPPEQGYLFKIWVPFSNVLQRERTYLFRAPSKEEYVVWVRALITVTGGTSQVPPMPSRPSLPAAALPQRTGSGSLTSVSEEEEQVGSKAFRQNVIPPIDPSARLSTDVDTMSHGDTSTSLADELGLPASHPRSSTQSAESIGSPATFGAAKSLDSALLQNTMYSTSAESFFIDPDVPPSSEAHKRFSALTNTPNGLMSMNEKDTVLIPFTDDTPLPPSEEHSRPSSPCFPAVTHTNAISSPSRPHSLDAGAPTSSPSPHTLAVDALSLSEFISHDMGQPYMAPISSSLP